MENKKLIGHLLALATAIVWGTSFVSTKTLLTDFTPFEILFLRFTIGYVALWALYPHKLKIEDKKMEFYLFIAGFSGVSLYFLCENYALIYTYASDVSLLVSVAPILTGVLAHFMSSEKLKKSFVIGFLCAIVGIGFISYNGSAVLHLNPLGDLLALGAALLWAIYSIYTKRVSDENYNTMGITRRIFLYGILTMIPMMFFMDFHIEKAALFKTSNLLNILYLALISSAVCYIAWNKSMEILGAVKTSVYIYFIPVVTMIFSALLLDEKITPVMLIGTALILSGLVLSERKSKS